MRLLIITDERCGSTVFTKMFKQILNLKVIHEPHINTNKIIKGYLGDSNSPMLLDYCFNVLKVNILTYTFHRLTFIECQKLIDYCIINDIKIIVLYRENIFSRALSITVARTLRNNGYKNSYGYKDITKIKPYKLDIVLYENEIIRYKKDYNNIMNYINYNKIDHYHITYNELYINNNRIENFKKLLDWISLSNVFCSPSLESLKNNKKCNSLLNIDYNTKEANKLILNMNQIEEINNKYITLIN